MSGQLRKCPFCGSGRVELKTYHGLFGVECCDCFRPSWRYYSTQRAAVEHWNRRDAEKDGDAV